MFQENVVTVAIRKRLPEPEEIEAFKEGESIVFPAITGDPIPEEGTIILLPSLGSSFDDTLTFKNKLKVGETIYIPTDIKTIEVKQSRVPLVLDFEYFSTDDKRGTFKPVKLSYKHFDLAVEGSDNFPSAFTDLSVKFEATGNPSFYELDLILNSINTDQSLISESLDIKPPEVEDYQDFEDYQQSYYYTYIKIFFKFKNQNGDFERLTNFQIVRI